MNNDEHLETGLKRGVLYCNSMIQYDYYSAVASFYWLFNQKLLKYDQTTNHV